MNKTTNNEKKELNIFLFLFLGFVILQHLGKIILNLMNLLTPQSEYFYISKSVYLYSIVLSIAMIVVVIGTISKKKWGVIGFFCIQIINLFSIQALSEGQADMSGAFGVTCALCAIFALLLCLRSKGGGSAWKIIFEQKESKPKKNYLFELRNLYWFKKENKELEHRDENSKAKEVVSLDFPLASEEKVKTPSDEPKTIEQHKRKPFVKVFLIVLSVIVIASIGVGSYFLYKHYTDNEYLMNKANETFKNGEIKKALEMYEELADKKDYVPAKSRLGNLYLYNDSVPVDIEKGKKYLEDAALNDTNAINTLLYTYSGGSIKYGTKLCDPLIVDKYTDLAIGQKKLLGPALFFKGYKHYISENYPLAFYYFKESSKYNYYRAFRFIGQMYYYGNGCTENNKKALYYFQRALELENNDGYVLEFLGEMYENGYGVSKNISKAKEYYRKAADNNNEDAKNKISLLEMNGN